jgi:hypothetical protein
MKVTSKFPTDLLFSGPFNPELMSCKLSSGSLTVPLQSDGGVGEKLRPRTAKDVVEADFKLFLFLAAECRSLVGTMLGSEVWEGVWELGGEFPSPLSIFLTNRGFFPNLI